MSVFFPALVGLVALEIRVSFLDFIDDGAISFPFFCYLRFCYDTQNTYMFPTVVTWLVFAIVWVCNNATLCYFFFTIVMT